jgi:hypothetical protein
MRYAIIKDGFVTNVIEWDGKATFIPDGELVQTDEPRVGVGIEYKDNAFVLPVIPDPPPLTYDLKREQSYPKIVDQLDMIFHAGEGGAEFQAAIKAVKDANPKPD